jgi:hypothetical protein
MTVGKIAKELWWTSQEIFPTGVTTMALHAHMSPGIVNRPVGGRGSEE